jgi:hypothetical protein
MTVFRWIQMGQEMISQIQRRDGNRCHPSVNQNRCLLCCGISLPLMPTSIFIRPAWNVISASNTVQHFVYHLVFLSIRTLLRPRAVVDGKVLLRSTEEPLEERFKNAVDLLADVFFSYHHHRRGR